MKFIHAADIHLDSPLKGLERYEGAPVEEIRSATRRAFDNLVTLAIEEAAEVVLLAGDLYDGDWKDYNTGLYFVDRMRRLEAAGIHVFIVAGNHDAASQITRQLRLPDNVKLFSTSKPETVEIEIGGLELAVHGQGFAKREVTADLSSAYPPAVPNRFNIGLLHTCLDGKPGHEPYAPCSVDGLRSKGYQYWALGHIHNREIVSEEPWIVFPGNIQGRHARETGRKGCSVVTVENSEIISVEHRDLDVMRWARAEIDISGIESVDEVYERVREVLQNVLDEADGRLVASRLILEGSSPVHSELHIDSERWIQEYRALASDMGGGGMWLEKVLLDTRQVINREELLERDDALGGLLRTIKKFEAGDAGLDDLALEIAPLRQKLPSEILVGDEGYDPTSPEYLIEMMEDIKELLIDRLVMTAEKQ
tara:strand:- start:1161 stop:2429 length:1269 start_codon:yes stop_codon:yes gene_type:complete